MPDRRKLLRTTKRVVPSSCLARLERAKLLNMVAPPCALTVYGSSRRQTTANTSCRVPPSAPSSLLIMMARRKVLAWLPAILWAGTLFFLSAQSSLPSIAPAVPDFDKVEHFGVYGLLGILVIDAVRRSTTLALPKAVLVAILITSAYGASDEFHQWFVPNRSCDVWDWTADTFGGILGVAVYAAYESRRSQKTNR